MFEKKAVLLLVFLLAIGTTAIYTLANGPSDGLLAHYPLDGDANDQSGNQLDGSFDPAQVVPTADRFGEADAAMSFAGMATSIIDLPLIAGPWKTISFWAKSGEIIRADVRGKGLIGDSPAYTATAGIQFGLWTRWYADEMISINSPGSSILDSYYWDTGAIGATIDTGWHLYVFVWDTDRYRLYMDGEDKGLAKVYGTPVLLDSEDFNVGAFNAFPFAGAIDDLRIYERSLEPAEIAELICVDLDQDGFCSDMDCDDEDPSINPVATELPGNFIDENCDGDLGNSNPCFPWESHGQFVQSVAHEVNFLVEQGLISPELAEQLVSAAAQSKIGKKGYIPPECQ